jgi:RimJ/RimL family protein N-acetyltransferase
LQGALVLLEPLDPDRHSYELFAVSHETDEARRVWAYLPDGPFDDFASFDEWVRRIVVERDRLYFAFRDKATGRLGGMATYLDIRPNMGAIEVGYIWFAPFLQRTRQPPRRCFSCCRTHSTNSGTVGCSGAATH